MQIRNSVFLVTGGASGLGAATARMAAENGAKVVIADLQPESGEKDVFVHATALEAAGIFSLNEGDKVSFVLEDDRKGRGKQAGQVQKA